MHKLILPHPALLHFPVFLWMASLSFDILYAINSTSVFAVLSYFSILSGLIASVLAVPNHLADYADIPRGGTPKGIATAHFILSFFIILLYICNFIARLELENGIPSMVSRGQIVLSIVSMALLSLSGYLGGLLVYEHGVEIHPAIRSKSENPDLRRAA